MQKNLATTGSRSSKSAVVAPAIRYRLSDKIFLELGWTSKPLISAVYPVILMRAKFSHSVICPWFRYREQDVTLRYPDGKVLCSAKKDATGKIYYPNGKKAIVVERGGRYNERTRVWVYSSGEVDKDGKKFSPRLCALFDSVGNGVVYDPTMKKRLAYNQKEVIWWDSPVGLPLIWKWHNIEFRGSVSVMNDEDAKQHVISDPPKQIMWVPTPKASPPEKEHRHTERIPSFESEELTKSEYEFREAAEHARYMDTGKKFPKQVSPIKPIVVRINQYLALRIYSQSEIILSFFTTTRQTTLQIGILYNPYDKLKVAEIDSSSFKERVICTFESLPAKTTSMVKFKKIVQTYRKASHHNKI